MAKNGKVGKIYLVTSGTPDIDTAIGGELSSNLTINQVIVDVSEKDNDWTEKIGGTKDWSCSGSFNLNEISTSKQVSLFSSLVAGTAVKLFIGEITTGRVFGYLGDALIESIAVTFDKDAAMTKEISFQGTGELTNITETVPTTVAPTTL